MSQEAPPPGPSPSVQSAVAVDGSVHTLTTRNSLLSTIWFPSASNMLKAILKPAWGSGGGHNTNQPLRAADIVLGDIGRYGLVSA